MIKNIIWLFLLILPISIIAQNSNEQFKKANSLYKNGEYVKAAELYEEIVKTNEVSSELFHNLGNCYYKLNSVGPAVYNYEKALRLNPLNEDAQNNLIFAKRLTLDRIEELPKSLLQKINLTYISKISYNGWAVISVLFSCITAVFFILYYFSINPANKRLFFTTGVLSFTLLFISLGITNHQFNKHSNTIEAIIYSSEVSVKNEPTQNADEAFIIHEGTKILVLDEVDEWKKIRLPDGKIGWLKSKDINVLNVF